MSGEWGGPVQESDPSGYGDYHAKQRAIEERLAALESPATLNNATMSGLLRVLGSILVEDGGVTIKDLGRFLVENGGSVAVNDGESRGLWYVGGFQETTPGVPNGYGAFLQRLDGSFALHFSDDSASEQTQRLKLYDRNGYFTFSEDPSGKGISRPLVPLHPWRGDSRTWSGTASADFTILAGARGQMHSPRVYVEVLYAATDATTEGELRVVCNGVQVGATVTSFDAAVGTAAFGPAVLAALDPGDGLDLTVQARRTAGAGEVMAELKYATAWPS